MLREVNSINKGDFPPLLFHFQRGPGPDVAEAIYCGSRAVTTAAGAGVICRLWLRFIGQLFLGGSSSFNHAVMYYCLNISCIYPAIVI